jgi:hypothetical protein
MKMKLLGLIGAAIIPCIMSGGAIGIGASASPLTFNPPDITLGSCVSNVCTISGAGSLQGAPLQWTIVTTLSGGNSITESGPGLVYPINQEGATIVFNLNDGPGPDSLAGSVVLSTATDSLFPDLTDIKGTITYSSVNLLTPALSAYLLANYGALPTVGSTAALDLTVTCGSTTECIPFAGDPTGTVLSATIAGGAASAAPEPGSIALCGAGVAGLLYRLRRRK